MKKTTISIAGNVTITGEITCPGLTIYLATPDTNVTLNDVPLTSGGTILTCDPGANVIIHGKLTGFKSIICDPGAHITYQNKTVTNTTLNDIIIDLTDETSCKPTDFELMPTNDNDHDYDDAGSASLIGLDNSYLIEVY